MEKLKPYLTWLSEHEKIIKAAAAVVILIAAVVFFGGIGEESDNSLDFKEAEQAQSTQSDETSLQDDMDEHGGIAQGPVYVDIGGCVKSPGVYQVVEGTRLFEVIKEAGGLTPDADVSQINQAETVTDGQKVVIPAMGETTGAIESPAAGNTGSAVTSDGKININLADSNQLQELPGVGPATAEKIINYREEHGSFASKEDIKNVSGIGNKTYEKMQDMIFV